MTIRELLGDLTYIVATNDIDTTAEVEIDYSCDDDWYCGEYEIINIRVDGRKVFLEANERHEWNVGRRLDSIKKMEHPTL